MSPGHHGVTFRGLKMAGQRKEDMTTNDNTASGVSVPGLVIVIVFLIAVIIWITVDNQDTVQEKVDSYYDCVDRAIALQLETGKDQSPDWYMPTHDISERCYAIVNSYY